MVNLRAKKKVIKNMTNLVIFSKLIWLIEKFGLTLRDISTNNI